MVVWSSTLRSIVQPGLAGIATRPGIFQAVLKNGKHILCYNENCAIDRCSTGSVMQSNYHQLVIFWHNWFRFDSTNINKQFCKILICNLCFAGAVQVRQMSDHGHRTMTVAPSRFQWQKFKDNLHFYTLVGAIPLGLLVFLVNIFVGPAKLTPIPEGYEPKHWEYHKVCVLLNWICRKTIHSNVCVCVCFLLFVFTASN